MSHSNGFGEPVKLSTPELYTAGYQVTPQ